MKSKVNRKVNKTKLINKDILNNKLTKSQIAKKFGVSKAYISQLNKSLSQIKFSGEITSKQSTPLTIQGFEGKAEKDGKKIKVSHASGPLFGNQIRITSSIMGYDTPYNKEVVEMWEPNMSLSVMDDTGKALSAAQINSKQKDNWVPVFFANPMQELDYITFEALSRSTIGGSIFQSIVKFLVGTGFRPELELINPSDDSRENQKEIDSHKDVIENLLLIDRQLTVDDKDNLDVSFTEKISGVILNTLIFNRGALIFGYEKPISINNNIYPEIPSSIKFAHPRDLGIIKVSSDTHRLEAVQWINAFDMIPVNEMIYLWNPLISSKTRNSWFYGDSMMLPMIDALRVIRKNVGVNFLAMAETSYAGRGILTVNPQGSTEQQKIDEYAQITKNMSVPATTHLLMEDPDNVRFFNINYDAKVKEFADLNESLIKYCVATTGMPHSMFYDESASNRACYSEDTMTLTESGWKYYNEIDWRNERIATLNPENGNIEYHYPDGISVYPYDGDMIHVKTRNQDVLVTPDHDMWVSSSHDKKYVKFEKIKAEELIKRKEFMFTEFGEWIGNTVPELYTLQTIEMNSYGPRIKQKSQQIISVKTDTWIQFMGYYLSEGTKSRTEKHGTSYFVSIAQSENSKSFNNFKRCMDEMPFTYYDNMDKDNCHKWRFSSKQLVSNLQDTGKLHDTKQIPRWMLQLQPEKLEILFNSMMEGDGTVNKEGSKIYYTTSIQLARDVQELALKLGYKANLKTHYEACKNKSKAYRVFITKNKGHLRSIQSINVTKEHYKGVVYCFSVKNHLFVTSRNGTVTVQGNTMIGKIQLAIATVINPMREWIGRSVSDQWYDRWFRLIYKDDPELLKKFHIKMVFDNLPITEWFDNVEAALELDLRKQLKDSKFGEIVGLQNYSDMVETDAITTPGGGGKNTIDIGNGKKLSIKDNKERLNTTDMI